MRVFDIKRLPFVHNQLVVCFDNCTGTSNTGRMNEQKWRLWFVRGKRPTNRESLDFLVRTKVPSLYNFQHTDWPMSRLPRNRSGNFDLSPPPGRWDRRWSGFCASYDPVSHTKKKWTNELFWVWKISWAYPCPRISIAIWIGHDDENPVKIVAEGCHVRVVAILSH